MKHHSAYIYIGILLFLLNACTKGEEGAYVPRSKASFSIQNLPEVHPDTLTVRVAVLDKSTHAYLSTHGFYYDSRSSAQLLTPCTLSDDGLVLKDNDYSQNISSLSDGQLIMAVYPGKKIFPEGYVEFSPNGVDSALYTTNPYVYTQNGRQAVLSIDSSLILRMSKIRFNVNNQNLKQFKLDSFYVFGVGNGLAQTGKIKYFPFTKQVVSNGKNSRMEYGSLSHSVDSISGMVVQYQVPLTNIASGIYGFKSKVAEILGLKENDNALQETMPILVKMKYSLDGKEHVITFPININGPYEFKPYNIYIFNINVMEEFIKVTMDKKSFEKGWEELSWKTQQLDTMKKITLLRFYVGTNKNEWDVITMNFL